MRFFWPMMIAVSVVWSLWLVSPVFAAEDKALHFGVSAPLGAVGTYAVDHAFPDAPNYSKVLGGVGIALIPGAFKEIADEEFSTGDMMANVTGALTTSLLYTYTDREDWERYWCKFKNGLTLDWRAMFVPPAHEPVVGNKVARYLLEITPGWESEYFRLHAIVKAWGVNTWIPPDVRGHGWEKYENSDWSVEEWRISTTLKVEIGPESLHFEVEYYRPRHNQTWGGHGMEKHYYLLAGVGGKY